jgi:hypothetical protein
MPDHPKLGRPRNELYRYLLEMATLALEEGGRPSSFALARHVATRRPGQTREAGIIYRYLDPKHWITEDDLIRQLRRRYDAEKSVLLSDARDIEQARQRGRCRTAGLLESVSNKPTRRRDATTRLGSVDVETLRRLLASPLLEARAKAYQQGCRDVQRKRRP